MKTLKRLLGLSIAAAVLYMTVVAPWLNQRAVLRRVVERLSADRRVAEVLVTQSEPQPGGRVRTTLKFLEFDVDSKPLPPRYLAFDGNLVQFQSLVIRFKDEFVTRGDRLRGKSAYLFWKAFVLDGSRTQEVVLTPVGEIPQGYKVPGVSSAFERRLWKRFWAYALDPAARDRAGVKNAQIEAPGTLFVPGTVYTLRIENDGGLRIDAQPLPEVLKGERFVTP